jgi:Ca2+-binding RTX toxin-like protein
MASITGSPSEGHDKIKITLDVKETYYLDTFGGNDSLQLYGGGYLQALLGAGDDWVSSTGTTETNISLGSGNDYFQAVGIGAKDVVAGNSGDDVIDTGKGDDWLKGGTGNDILTGGAGADTFNYPFNTERDLSTGAFASYVSICGHDVITDFKVGTDKLEFGKDRLDFTQFSQLFEVQTGDYDGDGDTDTRVSIDGDGSFSVTLLDNALTEALLYQSVSWFA